MHEYACESGVLPGGSPRQAGGNESFKASATIRQTSEVDLRRKRRIGDTIVLKPKSFKLAPKDRLAAELGA